MRAGRLALLLSGALSGSPVQAGPDFDQYVASLKEQALAAGMLPETVSAAFADVHLVDAAIRHDKNQPEFKLTLDTYIPRAVPEWKVKQAQTLYRQHLPLLTKIGREYGVQPRFIVALWGIETNFGKITGHYPLISSLSTLAWDGRREAFFKGQLFDALRILEQGHVNPANFKGSWAGAMGQVQFMPSSFLRYAVDQDGDGKKDLWGNLADVFGSAANYLSQNGWREDQTWGRRVRVPERLDPALLGLPASPWRPGRPSGFASRTAHLCLWSTCRPPSSALTIFTGEATLPMTITGYCVTGIAPPISWWPSAPWPIAS